MSSPGMFQCQPPQPQGPPADAGTDADEDGLSIRLMRLKVLYTFDDQNNTKCLARGSDVLQVKTIAMDETSSIGIIDLKTCIELVVQSSPELVARLGQDYTIYAYDYSEYDTPLVGQGMLSQVLASSSLTPDASPQHNERLITGRVCKNKLGIFNNGVKETLEVKLRLVSVPTAVQGEPASQMEKYREMTKATWFDPSEWASFLQANPGFGQIAGAASGQMQRPSSRSGSINLEVVDKLLNPTLSQPQIDFLDKANAENSGNESRPSSKGGKAKNTSRPSSRASLRRQRKPRQPKTAAVGGSTSGYEEEAEADDGPAAKKRAKITKADWSSKSSFGTGSDSLRVTASTAGSLRMFRPIAIGSETPSHLQEIPRAPTPVPDMPRTRRPGRPITRTNRRGSTVSQNGLRTLSPSPQLEVAAVQEDDLKFSIESAGPSPERHSPAETSPDIGSSPPLLRTVSPLRSSPSWPSSPILPQMLRDETDSGFMSGTLDDLFGEDNGELHLMDESDIDTSLKGNGQLAPPCTDEVQDFEILLENPGPVELLPTRMPVVEQFPLKGKASKQPSKFRAESVMSEDGQQRLLHLKSVKPLLSLHPTPGLPAVEIQMGQTRDESQSTDPHFVDSSVHPSMLLQDISHHMPAQGPSPATSDVPESRPMSRTMARTASMGSLTLPTIHASDPVRPPSTLHRSQTWSEAPHPASEATMPYTPGVPWYPPPDAAVVAEYNRTQPLEAKKAAMKQKLDNAIMNGVMPPFCVNCGAIETPTWRKAWSQDVMGAPPYYEYSDQPGKVTMIVVLTRDEQGNPTSYQLIKKFLLKEEDPSAYKEVILCNPCGLWVSKYKAHRPEEKWECNKNKKPLEKKRKVFQRPTNSKKSNNSTNPDSTFEANNPQMDANLQQTLAHQQQFAAEEPAEDASHMQQIQCRQSEDSRSMKRLHPMTSDAAPAALKRALKSSPARWTGTIQGPVNVEEEDLGSTRRVLFPSPRDRGSPKVLGEVITNVVTVATDFRSPKKATMGLPSKENCRPAMNGEECDVDFLRLFEEEMARPSTPKRKSPSQNVFNTPTRHTPCHRPITRSVSRSLRSAKSPEELLLFQKTPSKTPSTSTRRRSPRNHNEIFESPFTATLNQIMSDVNEHYSPTRGMQLDFPALPDLPDLESTAHTDYTFDDFFSTDVHMPSSPPRVDFHLHEDSLTMSNISWSEFDAAMLGSAARNERSEEATIKKDPCNGAEPAERAKRNEGSETGMSS